MAGRVGQGDLLAGGAAVAALLLLVARGVKPWLAILLAVMIYGVVVLLRPWRKHRDVTGDNARQHDLAYQAALANVAAIRTLAPRIAKPAVREQVDRILDRTARVLGAMREDGTQASARDFNDRLLVPFHGLLTEYVRLSSRGVRSAGDLLEKTETRELPMIERAIDGYYEHLHRAHLVDLATLGEMLELNLEGIRATTPRRFTL
jgi:hypothetical protein